MKIQTKRQTGWMILAILVFGGWLKAGEPLTPQGPIEPLSSTRAMICLNGWWKFTPAPDKADTPPSDWGRIRVPGSWAASETWPSGPRAELIPGSTDIWKPFRDTGKSDDKGRTVEKAYYEREITIPAEWAGRRIVLDLRRVSTDARVFLNEKPVGDVEWPTGEVDLTDALPAGSTGTLRILVAAVREQGLVATYMETAERQITKSAAKLYSRGLIGDVFLVSRPQGAYISDVFVMPSFRKKQVTLRVEVAGVTQGGEVKLEARMLNEQGEAEKTFTSSVTLKATPIQTFEVSWPWENPRLWDLDQPNLYTLQLRAKGAGLDDEYPQRFGFREFWIEGKHFYLNGTKFRMRPCLGSITGEPPVVEQIDAMISQIRSRGYNIQEFWPTAHDRRSVWIYRELYAERASLKGFPVTGVALSVNDVIELWHNEADRKRWESRMIAELKRYRNQPSIVMWGCSGNYFGHRDDQNPRKIGRRGWADSDPAFKERVQRGMEAIACIRKADPTRPIFTHQGCYVGDVYTANNYLNILPLQEREEWLSEWAKKGEMPYWAVEFEMPIDLTMRRGRCGFGPTQHSEPFVTEYAAIYFGREAYLREDANYRRAIASEFDSKKKEYRLSISNQENFQRLLALNIPRLWRAWRTWDISGGMIPWNDGHAYIPKGNAREKVDLPPFEPGRRGVYYPKVERMSIVPTLEETHTLTLAGKALLENNNETLAWIAGSPKAFIAKEHNFVAGKPIEKQVVLLNDTRAACPYSCTWEISVGGNRIDGGTQEGTIAVGETLFLPISVLAPTVNIKTDGVITLQATIGKRQHEDRFVFRVFPPPQKLGASVHLFDPVGETNALLEKGLGCTVKEWTGSTNPKEVPFLIIGRKVLGPDVVLPGDLESYVKNGGRLLIMAQHRDVLTNHYLFRVCGHVSRYAYPVDPSHPVTAGIDAEDLRDWRGESTMVEAYPLEHRLNVHGTPYYGWHWGNRGAVASISLEKPHRTGWRPILEHEFDLQYSPLMELDYGQGRVIFCGLDLEDASKGDPAAFFLARNLVEYAAQAPLAPRATKTLYIGSDRGKAILDLLEVVYEVGSEGAACDLLITDRPELAGKAKRVVVLPRNEEGTGLKKKHDFAGSLSVPDWPECRGLSPSDLRWRTPEIALLLEGEGVGADGLLRRRIEGEKVTIECQIDPLLFDVSKKPYLRLTRWRQTRAVAQILANMGATFALDRRIFTPIDPRKDTLSLAGEWKAKMFVKLPLAPAENKPADPGISPEAEAALAPEFDDTSWETVKVPGIWEEYGPAWANTEGEVVFRKKVNLPASMVGKHLVLSLSTLDDKDHTRVNGKKVGETDGWDKKRLYTIPSRYIKDGELILAIRIWDCYGGGGFTGLPEEIFLRPADYKPPASYYHPDYIAEYDFGDDPYRYYRW